MKFDRDILQAGFAGTRCAPRVVALADVVRGQGTLVRTFVHAGAMVEEVADMPAMLARVQRDPPPDLLVLDRETLGTDEVAALKSLLLRSGPAAVLLLPRGSASGPGLDSVMPIEVLLGKPLPAERGGAAFPERSNESGLELRLELTRACWKGRRVDLSLSEFRIVSRLAAAPRSDVSHRELYDVTKGEGFVSGRGALGYRGNVRAAIKRIRQKFRRIDPGFTAIRSYHGYGYRWEEAERAVPADAERG